MTTRFFKSRSFESVLGSLSQVLQNQVLEVLFFALWKPNIQWVWHNLIQNEYSIYEGIRSISLFPSYRGCRQVLQFHNDFQNRTVCVFYLLPASSALYATISATPAATKSAFFTSAIASSAIIMATSVTRLSIFASVRKWRTSIPKPVLVRMHVTVIVSFFIGTRIHVRGHT